jgi:hypothetical protein
VFEVLCTKSLLAVKDRCCIARNAECGPVFV